MNWRLAIVLLACFAVAGCVTAAYQPPASDASGPVHGESGGDGGSGAGM
jgi:hypothetical protein